MNGNMSNEKLLNASMNGDLNLIKHLLSIKNIDINWKDILIKIINKIQIYFFS